MFLTSPRFLSTLTIVYAAQLDVVYTLSRLSQFNDYNAIRTTN